MTHSLSGFTDRLPSWLHASWFFVLLAIALYANTIGNKFALDDGLVLNENRFVLQGISGIPDIMAHDSFEGSVGKSAYLSGGRYRPLSLVTYAIEVSLFGLEPAVHHGTNVLLFALTCVLLHLFLRRHVFREHQWAAWCTTLLFTIHPIHTEVVANIKGRDELLSLIFLLMTLHHSLQSVAWSKEKAALPTEPKRKRTKAGSANSIKGEWSGILSVVFFVLALLSKENGLVFIGLLPLTLYFFAGLKISEAIRRSLPVIVVVVLYVAVRVVLLGARNNAVQEIMDNPYLFATLDVKLASIAYVFLFYIRLLFWPDPLVYDYSFNQVPLHSFTDPVVIVSILFHVSILVYAVIQFPKRDVIAWCVLAYLGTLFLVSNLVFNIGAPLGERFLYQSSVPFLIVLVEVVRRVVQLVPRGQALGPAIGFVLLLVTAFSGYAIADRNRDWRTGDDLFLHDVYNAPNSARARTYAGIALIHRSDSADTKEEKRAFASDAIKQFLIADSIHPRYMPTLLNMGLAHFRLDSLEVAEGWWERAHAVDPDDGKLKQLEAFLFEHYYQGGLKAGLGGDLVEGRRQLELAVKYAPNNADAWYNLGGVHYTAGDLVLARTAWEKALVLAPGHAQTRQGMAALAAAENAIDKPGPEQN